jgi:TonB family protein
MKFTATPFACAWMLAALLSLGLLAAPHAHADGAPPKVLKKVPPEFPPEATRARVSDGVLKAKLSVDGQGSVTDVTIVEATPPKAKVFSEAAIAALSKWKFEPSGKGEVFEIKLVFSQD